MAVRKLNGRWWIDVRHRGRRYRLRSPDDRRDGAIQYELSVRSRLARGEEVFLATDPRAKLRPAAEVLFQEFAAEWFETHVKSYLRPSTQRKYVSMFTSHLLPAFGRQPLAAITSSSIKAFAGSLLRAGLKPKTANGVLSALHCCLHMAVEWERLPLAPRISWLRGQPASFDYLSSAESARLLKAATERPYDVMIRTALRTGMRIGELLALKWTDVDLEQRLITVRHSLGRDGEFAPKNGRHRYIPISGDLCEALAAIARLDGYVFSHDRESRFPLREPRKGLWRALALAGLRRLGWHALRHTFASQLVTEGVPIYAAQTLLGHSTVQMTMRYAHLAPSALRSSVEVLHDAEKREAERLGNTRATTGEHKANEPLLQA